MKLTILRGILAAAILSSGCAENTVSAPSVIPQPVKMIPGKGAFTLNSSATIKYTGGEYAEGVANYLAGLLRPSTGFILKTEEGTGGAVNLIVDTTLAWQPEEYRLTVEKKRVTLTGCTPAGLSRGVQTLRQLMPEAIGNTSVVKGVRWTMPC